MLVYQLATECSLLPDPQGLKISRERLDFLFAGSGGLDVLFEVGGGGAGTPPHAPSKFKQLRGWISYLRWGAGERGVVLFEVGKGEGGGISFKAF